MIVSAPTTLFTAGQTREALVETTLNNRAVPLPRFTNGVEMTRQDPLAELFRVISTNREKPVMAPPVDGRRRPRGRRRWRT